MREIKNHKAYGLLNGKYNRVCLDYVVLASDEEYEEEATHKKAVLEAFDILKSRDDFFECDMSLDESKMSAEKISADTFLELPPEDFCGNKSHTAPSPLPYWYAFLCPPQGTPYSKEDFEEFNEILLPNKEDVEVYKWSDDFSDYFDAGKEWWGTGLWTAFDLKTNTVVVIGASLTD